MATPGMVLWNAIKEGDSPLSEAEKLRRDADANPTDDVLALIACDATAEELGGDPTKLMIDRDRIRMAHAAKLVTGRSKTASKARRIIRDAITFSRRGAGPIIVRIGTTAPMAVGAGGYYVPQGVVQGEGLTAWDKVRRRVIYVALGKSIIVGHDWILAHCV